MVDLGNKDDIIDNDTSLECISNEEDDIQNDVEEDILEDKLIDKMDYYMNEEYQRGLISERDVENGIKICASTKNFHLTSH